MIKCNKCLSESEYNGGPCPNCGAAYELSDIECDRLLSVARAALKARDYPNAIDAMHLLADLGNTEAEREWGAILERGAIVARDLDGAMRYFAAAAMKNDPYSAYRYSRLAARTSDKSSRFWLTYAAILGSKDAFIPAAEHYSDTGDEETASYYYSLAAACDVTDAIVTMAKRYYNGIGLPKSDEAARWYMDKLLLPPFHAIRLAYRLRGVKGKEPERIRLLRRDAIMKGLFRDAESYGLDKTAFHIAKLRAESKNADALFCLGRLYAVGYGCEKNIAEAISLLDRAAVAGSSEAAKYLADLFILGVEVERDVDRAIRYYRHSTTLGGTEAYEAMGDIFYEGTLIERDVAYAIELYERGAREGEANSKKKAKELKEKRESYYILGKERQADDEETAYKCFAISAAMGFLPAYRELAACLEQGRGTRTDRRAAYCWYEAAVEDGDLDALYDLGRCHAYGIGTSFDFDKATDILLKSKRHGSRAAESELRRLFENKKRAMSRSLFSTGMRLIYKKRFAEAKDILEACASLDNPKAIYTLGCIYEFGLGGRTDREKAFALYDKAFSLRFRDPRQKFKLRILRMIR